MHHFLYIATQFLIEFMRGMGSALFFSSSELYRSPYRHSGEALRGDWLRIGGDCEQWIDRDADLLD